MKIYKWKYSEEERPTGKCPFCYDCEMQYGTFPDVLLTSELWEKINPSNHKGSGILCPTCIAIRLDQAGLGNENCLVSVNISAGSKINSDYRKYE